LECMETAIKAGDWVVDGACDPDFILYMLRTRLAQPEPEEKKYTEESCPVCGYYCLGKGGVNCIDKPKLCGINTAPPQRERVQFPTMLRKMWSGTEVQAWLDENVNQENNND